jgi:probable DNA repair protein
MQILHNKEQLLSLLKQGAFVVTPNNRLSNIIHEDYFRYCQQRTIIKPRCMPYTLALVHLFQKQRFNGGHATTPHLLNELQCRYLWQLIIKETPGITFSEGLLRAAMDAWQHCEQWQIHPDEARFSHTPQTQLFQKWWKQFNQRLNLFNAITTQHIIPHLTQHNKKLITSALVWVCFDELTPQQTHLQTYLAQQGIVQYRYDLNKKTPEPLVFAAEQTKEEYEQLVHWIHYQLAQGATKIGVVVPELQQEYRRIHRLLTHHFDPKQFNISLGEPLSSYPLVAHALTWLELGNECTPQQADILLHSPYISASEKELVARSQIRQDNKLLEQPCFTLKALAESITHSAPKLSTLLGGLPPYPKKASPDEWVDLFQHRLNNLGFPGDAGLNSAQYQCYRRVIALFDEFRQLGQVASCFSSLEASETLKQLAQNTIFQIQKKQASIHILGLLEASGCEFDSLWVMGLTDQCLPAKPQLSAFIPVELQHTLQMPYSSAQRELQLAKQILHRFNKGSDETVLSYAKLQGDSPNLPCALINEYAPYSKKEPLDTQKEEHALERYLEEYTVPIKNEERITGGTTLLSNQAKCPFKAFAAHRLVAKKPSPELSDGVDHAIRGTIMHHIMDLLWQKIHSQANLLTTSEHQLEQWIDEAIQRANQTLSSAPQAPLVQEIEHLRLKRVVLACLEWDKKRPPFTIQALEQSYAVNLAGLDIKIRVDRLDTVDEKTWVIDYKSALPNTRPWNEERPQEPQLLLYALLNEQINTLLFLQVKTGAIVCSGFSESKLAIKGISSLKKDETWTNVRTYWQQQLTTLSKEILAGHCPPTPRNNTICSYCDFKDLCRI